MEQEKILPDGRPADIHAVLKPPENFLALNISAGTKSTGVLTPEQAGAIRRLRELAGTFIPI